MDQGSNVNRLSISAFLDADACPSGLKHLVDGLAGDLAAVRLVDHCVAFRHGAEDAEDVAVGVGDCHGVRVRMVTEEGPRRARWIRSWPGLR